MHHWLTGYGRPWSEES